MLDSIGVGACDDPALANLRNQKIGFIFQKYHLIPQYTVLQNVLLPRLVQGKSRDEAMAIVRALVTTPALLLADEPTGALDSATGKEILALFKELNDMGNTIIMITHDLNVAQHSQRITYLTDGVLDIH